MSPPVFGRSVYPFSFLFNESTKSFNKIFIVMFFLGGRIFDCNQNVPKNFIVKLYFN